MSEGVGASVIAGSSSDEREDANHLLGRVMVTGLFMGKAVGLRS